MTPFEEMAQWYANHPTEQSFAWYVDWHLKHGFVFSTPEFFVLGRPVLRAAGEARICEPTHLFNPDDCDCWYLHALAGDMGKVWGIMPWPLGWIAFERTRDGKRELQVLPTERLRFFSENPLQQHEMATTD